MAMECECTPVFIGNDGIRTVRRMVIKFEYPIPFEVDQTFVVIHHSVLFKSLINICSI